MIDLCNILKITVNDLLSGYKVNKEEYITQADTNLIKLQKQKEATNISVRVGYIFSMVILLILNVVNVFAYGVAEAIEKTEFVIMV